MKKKKKEGCNGATMSNSQGRESLWMLGGRRELVVARAGPGTVRIEKGAVAATLCLSVLLFGGRGLNKKKFTREKTRLDKMG